MCAIVPGQGAHRTFKVYPLCPPRHLSPSTPSVSRSRNLARITCTASFFRLCTLILLLQLARVSCFSRATLRPTASRLAFQSFRSKADVHNYEYLRRPVNPLCRPILAMTGGRLKERDALFELVLKWITHPEWDMTLTLRDAVAKTEHLIDEHMVNPQGSELSRKCPGVAPFFTRYPSSSTFSGFCSPLISASKPHLRRRCSQPLPDFRTPACRLPLIKALDFFGSRVSVEERQYVPPTFSGRLLFLPLSCTLPVLECSRNKQLPALFLLACTSHQHRLLLIRKPDSAGADHSMDGACGVGDERRGEADFQHSAGVRNAGGNQDVDF